MHGDDAAQAAERARLTYAAMQRWHFLDDRRRLYRETAARSAPDAFVWPYSRALQGTLTLAGLPGRFEPEEYGTAVADRLTGLTRYRDRRARRPAYDSTVRPWIGSSGDKFHDDNVWLALAFVQAYRMGLVESLDPAIELFRFGESGWDTSTTAPWPGGVFWVQQGRGLGVHNHDRGAGTTAGNALLAFQLAELGPPVEAAGWRATGERLLDWVDRTLDSAPHDRGLIWNAVNGDGQIDRNLWSYNQGVVIGARVRAFQQTGDPAQLADAEALAWQTLRRFGDFTNHPPAFNAMCLQQLLVLRGVSADDMLGPAIRAQLTAYGDWAWDPRTGARDPETGLFRFEDSGHPAGADRPAKLEDQGALVQLYGLLAWDHQACARLA